MKNSMYVHSKLCLYSCTDCPSCQAYAIHIGWAAGAILTAIMTYTALSWINTRERYKDKDYKQRFYIKPNTFLKSKLNIMVYIIFVQSFIHQLLCF